MLASLFVSHVEALLVIVSVRNILVDSHTALVDSTYTSSSEGDCPSLCLLYFLSCYEQLGTCYELLPCQ